MCASPMAPPPSSATPILGRGRGAGFCCARKDSGSRSNNKMKTMRRMQASSVVHQDRSIRKCLMSLAQRGDSSKRERKI